MVIFKNVKDIQQYISEKKAAGLRPGFIPTMGALHAGHLSLIGKAKEDGMLVICSIFVNPTQFNDKKDFEQYPVSIDADIELLVNAGCDVLFLPPQSEIYPEGVEKAATFQFGYLDTILEGAKRPGHFKGVGQVVAKLLNIVQPERLYLGQKDYQQCMVISKLVKLMGIETTGVVICPTVREQDGLAMSSRNRRLTESQRAIAVTIYQCLVLVESKQKISSFALVRKECEDLLKAKGFEVEYVALANARGLELFEEYQPGSPMVALIAARLGEIRLIDNMVLG